ncbi:MAG: hypothetical protein MSS87_08575 [Bacteroidales bacterium]|nr:hypothetical protein [Bacteroidales bacterium]MDY5737572.1 hypothetical protein [Candidatus Onthomorpha sp.]
MDNKEAMFWLAILQQANEGSKEAQEMLQQENELRTESGQPTVQEALKEKIEEAKTKDILQNGKVIWERP